VSQSALAVGGGSRVGGKERASWATCVVGLARKGEGEKGDQLGCQRHWIGPRERESKGDFFLFYFLKSN
jgi:hypothetical protein